ncbi:MAG: choice-of-anchor Q domain-containing protein, partial [Saprospiraceae bacterium]
DIEDVGGVSSTVSHSLLQVYTGGMTNSIVGLNPLFVDESDPDGADDISGTADDGLRLRPCSPALDAGEDNGSNPNVPVLDILGNGRLAATDMGCYEYQMTSSSPHIYVDIDATGMDDGSSWADAYADLQDAIDHACAGEEIWVAEGTYYPSRVPMGATIPIGSLTNRDHAFLLSKDVRIYGGFDATETMLSERNHQTNPTILSGASDNCYHVLITAGLTSTAVLDGFRITEGNADGTNILNYNNTGYYFNRNICGGMYNIDSSPSVSDCSFYNNNTIGIGGGMYNNNSSPSVSACNFYNNTAAGNGGGMCNYYSSSPTVSNCNFYDNMVNYEGGGMYNSSSSPKVSNCNFYRNTADTGGGGIYNNFSASSDIINCIFWANEENGTTTAANSDIKNDGMSNSSTITHSLLQVYTGGTSNITGQDPLFVDESDPDGADDIPSTADDGLALQPCSPAINVGTTTSPIIPTDILGNLRVGVYDMGAYENQNPSSFLAGGVIYVDVDAVGNNDGTSWTDAFTDLQFALDVYCVNSDVWVAKGTYIPSVSPTGGSDARDKTFFLPDGVAIYGGFEGMESTLTARDIPNNPTILNGNMGAVGNAYHVILASADASTGIGVTIDGFSIMGGNADSNTSTTINTNNMGRNYGGGITISNGSNVIANNIIHSNAANFGGGGINIRGGTNTLDNNVIHSNAANFGGGISAFDGVNTFHGNVMYSNTAVFYGGAFYLDDNVNVLENNTIYSNIADNLGGGVFSNSGTNTLRNNIFWGNIRAGNDDVAGADIK